MSFDRVIIPGLDGDRQHLLDELITQLRSKTPRNMERSAFYDGKNAAADLAGISIPTLNRTKIVLGWAAKAVDILNDRCNLDGFTTNSAVDLDSLGLAQLWDDNYLDIEAPQVGASSLIHSVAFLITTPGEDDFEPPVVITAKDALSATGMWDRRQRRLTSFLSVHRQDEHGDMIDFSLYTYNKIIHCVRNGGWDVEEVDHRFGLPVEPLPYSPRLSRPFGSSRISRVVMSLHKAAIRTALRSEVSAELYSVPQRVLLGANESAFQNADGSIKPAWQAIMGRLWAIEDDEDASNPRADVKEFAGASQQPHMDQLRAQAQQFAGETCIPVASLGLGADDANPTSADAYYASREDLIRRAEGTTDGWTPAWRRTMIRAIMMANNMIEMPDDLRSLKPKWRNPITTSRAAAADAASKMIDKFPWLAQSELGLELYGVDQGFLERARAELRRQRGAGVLARLTAVPEQEQDQAEDQPEDDQVEAS